MKQSIQGDTKRGKSFIEQSRARIIESEKDESRKKSTFIAPRSLKSVKEEVKKKSLSTSTKLRNSMKISNHGVNDAPDRNFIDIEEIER